MTKEDTTLVAGMKDPVSFLSAIDKASDDKGKGKNSARAVLKILKNVTDDKILAYVLVLTSNLLAVDAKRVAPWFVNESGSLEAQSFLRIATSSNEAPVYFHAISSLSYLLANSPANDTIIETFVSWLVNEAGSKGTLKLPAVLNGVMLLSASKKLRAVILTNKGLKVLSTLLKIATKPQTIYQVVFCVWTLSYLEAAAPYFLKKGGDDVIAGLAFVLQNATKEKIIRVGISALKNLVDRPGCNTEMIECKLMKFLQTLSARTFSDPEILEDIQVIIEGLQKDYQVFSSFDKYSKEINSGVLEWGPVHTESFWRENVRNMEKDNFGLIKKLVAQLEAKVSNVAVAVACFDLGEFMRYYPNGKAIVKSFNGKALIMGLLEHADKDVKNQALLCCSKMMVTNWEFIDAK